MVGHDTPTRMVSVDDARFALVVTAHTVPFQRSTSESDERPTGVLDVADRDARRRARARHALQQVPVAGRGVRARGDRPGRAVPSFDQRRRGRQASGLPHADRKAARRARARDGVQLVVAVGRLVRRRRHGPRRAVPAQHECLRRAPSRNPAAKQLVADGHDTDVNSAPEAPGCGTLTSVHAEPSQCSTRMRVGCPSAR